ncbi:MAG: orotidine-5'-phosphate decarboxylase [Planctomycetota bacterium]|nr:orotidine-5'-phosphate decarboxylase [Planctomycetota bacterium]
MAETFADRLVAAIDQKKAPICVGVDPIFEMLPDAVAGSCEDRDANDAEGAIDAIFDFTAAVLKIVAPLVPVVKFQSAYFEKYYAEGVEAYYSLVQEAKELGLLVIGDVKRGDIGSTASAYAAGHLADGPYGEQDEMVTPDAITVNPMLGLDTLEPFVKTAKEYRKGLFVLVRTSNPGSADFQDVLLQDGRSWSEMVADKLAPVAEGMVGASGFSSIGAVVGATQTHTMESLRKRLPKSIFLLPGYGAQGATAEMTRAAFINGQGAIVSASRSILYAHREKKYEGVGDWKKCVERAVVDMRGDLVGVVEKA